MSLILEDYVLFDGRRLARALCLSLIGITRLRMGGWPSLSLIESPPREAAPSFAVFEGRVFSNVSSR